MRIGLHGRPAAFEPVPAAILPLKPPHALEGLPRNRVELTRRQSVIGSQQRCCHNDLGIPPGSLAFPALLDHRFEELSHLLRRRRDRFQRGTRHQIGEVRVAGAALAVLLPMQGSGIEVARGERRGELASNRFFRRKLRGLLDIVERDPLAILGQHLQRENRQQHSQQASESNHRFSLKGPGSQPRTIPPPMTSPSCRPSRANARPYASPSPGWAP